MSDAFTSTIEIIGRVVDLAGVVAIVLGILVASIRYFRRQASADGELSFKLFRHGIGRALLLGLEILVAADVIRTVALEPTFRSVGVLAGIVVIRTFLSWSLEVELNGRWPWEAKPAPQAERPGI